MTKFYKYVSTYLRDIQMYPLFIIFVLRDVDVRRFDLGVGSVTNLIYFHFSCHEI